MTYVKNPNYWDADNVTVDEMNVMLTSDDVSAYTAYQNGDLDLLIQFLQQRLRQLRRQASSTQLTTLEHTT